MIGPRLTAIAQALPWGARVADIGCDHAYLAIELVKSGRSPYAVASDVNAGPLQAARQNIHKAGLDDRIDVRLGDGLEPLAPGQVEAVAIAGMGGALMAQILGRDRALTDSLQALVLSPNVAPWLVRQWADDCGYAIGREQVVEEAGHFYEIITVCPQDKAAPLSPVQCRFGPWLLQDHSPLTCRYFENCRAKDRIRMEALEKAKAGHPEAAAQFDRLTELWKQWEESRS
jgi:tRNA (adenine22-N1)-methyltransferase